MKIELMNKEQFAEFLQKEIMGGTSVSNIMDHLDSWTNKDDFEQAVRPLMYYLGKHQHPMMKCIVESNCAVLSESVKSVVTDEYLVD